MALSRNFVLVTDDVDKIHIDLDQSGQEDRILVRRAGSRSPAFSLTYDDARELVDAIGEFL